VNAINDFLAAIPSAASSPLALIAFLATIMAWVYTKLKTSRLKVVLPHILNIPERDRRKVIRELLGEIVPESMTANEWIAQKKNGYLLIAYLATLAFILIVGALAIVVEMPKLFIEDVLQPKLENGRETSRSAGRFIFVDQKVSSSDPQLGTSSFSLESERKIYAFDILVRNPSRKPIYVIETKIVFDPVRNLSGYNIIDIDGTYVITVLKDSAEIAINEDRYEANAWYPSGKGSLIITAPLRHEVPPRSSKAIRIKVDFPDGYEFRGSMKEAVVGLFWNDRKYVESKKIKLR
jgi:hypothetical protein